MAGIHQHVLMYVILLSTFEHIGVCHRYNCHLSHLTAASMGQISLTKKPQLIEWDTRLVSYDS